MTQNTTQNTTDHTQNTTDHTQNVHTQKSSCYTPPLRLLNSHARLPKVARERVAGALLLELLLVNLRFRREVGLVLIGGVGRGADYVAAVVKF